MRWGEVKVERDKRIWDEEGYRRVFRSGWPSYTLRALNTFHFVYFSCLSNIFVSRDKHRRDSLNLNKYSRSSFIHSFADKIPPCSHPSFFRQKILKERRRRWHFVSVDVCKGKALHWIYPYRHIEVMHPGGRLILLYYWIRWREVPRGGERSRLLFFTMSLITTTIGKLTRKSI